MEKVNDEELPLFMCQGSALDKKALEVAGALVDAQEEESEEEIDPKLIRKKKSKRKSKLNRRFDPLEKAKKRSTTGELQVSMRMFGME